MCSELRALSYELTANFQLSILNIIMHYALCIMNYELKKL